AWNSAGSLGPCLDAIALSSLNRHAPHRLRVMVCDDGSTDSTQADLRARRRDLDLLVMRHDHRSQAFAINAALERAEADVIVFCDADMLLGCGALDEIAARHERWPEVVPRWGYQDALLVARLEALGAFVLPVTTAWGWHVVHEIRHADQWFQYRRNGLAYAEILAQKSAELSWRVPDAPLVREVWSA